MSKLALTAVVVLALIMVLVQPAMLVFGLRFLGVEIELTWRTYIGATLVTTAFYYPRDRK